MSKFIGESPKAVKLKIGILLILLRATSTENTQIFVRISSYDNAEISVNPHERTLISSSVECAMVCFVTTSCFSFSYQSAELKCRGHDIHFLNSTTLQAPLGSGWEYFTYVFSGLTKEYQGHSYVMVHQKSTWIKARTYCTAMHYYLLEITSTEENTMIDGLAQNTQVWTGLYNNTSSNTGFMWNHSMRPADDYNNWKPGEPSNHPSEYCVIFDVYGKWIDIPCDKEKAFICEK